MKLITIFPNIDPFPKQEKKGIEAKKAIKGEIIEVKDLKHLSEIISKHAWSPSIFNNTRKKVNFISTDYITLDIDDNMALEEANSILKYLRWSYLIATTTNHQLNKNGVTCDRFRIVIPTEEIITKVDDFYLNWDNLTKYFPADPTCRDISRFYFGCYSGKIHENREYILERNKEKKTIKTKTKKITNQLGKLSFRTITFLESKGEAKNWHIEFLFAVRDLKAQGYNYSQSEQILSKITGHLDEKHDYPQLKYVYEDTSIEFEYRKVY